MTPGFSPEPKGAAANAINKKRKADGESDDDEEGGDKVFIPDIRELDILCGRGKSFVTAVYCCISYSAYLFLTLKMTAHT